MATCPVQPLFDLAQCFAALTPGEREIVALQLLCQISGMTTCDIQDLLDEGKCFAALTPGQRAIVGLQLLCNITGGGGSGGWLTGDGNPNTLGIVGTSVGQRYFDTSGSCGVAYWTGTDWCP